MTLQGKTVLVTRPAHQAEELARPLRELGAEVIILPAIDIAPPEDTAPLDDALLHLERYDWIVLTSVNGVEAVRNRMDSLGVPLGRLSELRIASIGPSTGQAIEDSFRAPDVVPAEYVSEAVAEALGDVNGQRFLLARADIARKDLNRILRERGAVVDEVVAYRIVPPAETPELPTTAPDYITLTSSSAARGTLQKLNEAGRADWFCQAAIVCIGPITADTVRDLGYEPAAVATDYTIPGLVAALLQCETRTEKTNA